MVYHIAGSNSDDSVPLKHEEILNPIDGDVSKITVIDTSRDGGRIASFSTGYSGRAIDPTHMPTRMRRKGNTGLPLHKVHEIWGGGLLVSDTFRNIVERFEPDVHQFFPIAIELRGKVIFERFYFHICNRLDTLAKDKCVPPVEVGKLYMPAYDGNDKVIFDTAAIGGHHFWNDKFSLGRYVSNQAFSALKDANLTGLGYEFYEQT